MVVHNTKSVLCKKQQNDRINNPFIALCYFSKKVQMSVVQITVSAVEMMQMSSFLTFICLLCPRRTSVKNKIKTCTKENLTHLLVVMKNLHAPHGWQEAAWPHIEDGRHYCRITWGAWVLPHTHLSVHTRMYIIKHEQMTKKWTAMYVNGFSLWNQESAWSD